jgi:hypothetical protein
LFPGIREILSLSNASKLQRDEFKNPSEAKNFADAGLYSLTKSGNPARSSIGPADRSAVPERQPLANPSLAWRIT